MLTTNNTHITSNKNSRPEAPPPTHRWRNTNIITTKAIEHRALIGGINLSILPVALRAGTSMLLLLASSAASSCYKHSIHRNKVTNNKAVHWRTRKQHSTQETRLPHRGVCSFPPTERQDNFPPTLTRPLLFFFESIGLSLFAPRPSEQRAGACPTDRSVRVGCAHLWSISIKHVERFFPGLA